MRIRKIELKNFGSHKFTQIDLESQNLSDSPIIIITGDTGSGKSTIIDALVFALFQNTLRYTLEDINSIRFHEADNNEETYVKIEFDTLEKEDNHRYSIKRAIKFLPKRDYLLEIEKDNIKIALNKQKLDEKIEKEIVKCSYKLFVRSIVLPQGQFSLLLKTDKPEERREILKRIFPETQIYEYIKDEINKRLLEVNDKKQKYEGEKEIILAQIDNSRKSIVSITDELKLDINSNTITDIENQLTTSIKSEKEELLTQKQSLEKIKHKNNIQIESLSKTLEKAQELQKLEENLENIRKTLSNLLTKIEINNLEENQIQTIKNQINDKKIYLKNKKNKILSILEEYKIKENDYNHLRTTFSHMKKILEETGKAFGITFRNRMELKEKIEELSNEIEKKEKLLEEINLLELERKLQELILIKEKINQKLLKNEEKNTIENEIINIEKQITENIQKTLKIQEDINLFKSREIEYFSIKIRETLKDGESCPVCGNTYHENKVTQIKRDTPYESEIEKNLKKLENELENLKKAQSSLETKREEKQNQITKIENELKILEKEIPIEFSSLPQVESEINSIQNKKNQKEKLEKEIRELDKMIQNLKISLNTLNKNYHEIIEPLEKQLRNFIETFTKEETVLEILGNIPSDVEITKFFNLEILQNLEKHKKETEETITTIEIIEKELTEFEKILSIVSDRKDNLTIPLDEIKKELEKIKMENNKIENEINQTEIKISRLDQLEGIILEKIRNVKELENKLVNVDEELKKLNREFDILKRLSNNFDTKGIINFVIKVKMLEIITNVNEYLSMLGIQDKKLSINFETDNLNFAIEYPDGTTKSINSLSGGESFLFSIALAFAIANDIVQNLKIKSIFIDEGFDTLDENFNSRLFLFLESFAKERDLTIYIITHKQEISENTNYPKIVVSKERGISKVKIEIPKIIN
ncbi:MAG: AAA family ATPase [Brevinematia bacterium]